MALIVLSIIMVCLKFSSWEAVAWGVVLFYAATNLVERNLRGSKYDY